MEEGTFGSGPAQMYKKKSQYVEKQQNFFLTGVLDTCRCGAHHQSLVSHQLPPTYSWLHLTPPGLSATQVNPRTSWLPLSIHLHAVEFDGFFFLIYGLNCILQQTGSLAFFKLFS